jgi:hypothetical protein
MEARRLHPHRIRFHFDHACTGIDIGSQRVTFRALEGAATRDGTDAPADGVAGDIVRAMEYDLLLAADGRNSIARAALEQQDPGFAVLEDLPSARSYNTFGELPFLGERSSEAAWKEKAVHHLEREPRTAFIDSRQTDAPECTLNGSPVVLGGRQGPTALITDTDRMQLVLFRVQNRTFGPYLQPLIGFPISQVDVHARDTACAGRCAVLVAPPVR